MLIRARAPLRLGFAGGGTDVVPFCDLFGGAVLNATIDLYAYCTIEPAPDDKIHFVAADVGETAVYDLSASVPVDGVLALHSGVYNRVVAQFNDGKPLAVTLTTSTDAPPGSGLGSSSTLVVVMVQAFSEFLSLPLGEYDTASLAWQIERCDLGLSGGRQDQYAAAFGGFNFMEFSGDERTIVNPLRIHRNTVYELEASLVICNTGMPRDSDAIIHAQSSNVKQGNEESLAATHKLKQEAVLMKEALLRGQIRRFAEVLEQGWLSKKKTAREVTNENLERIYQSAMAGGAYSGKVSGAGGGGFMMFVVDPVRRPDVFRLLRCQQVQPMAVQFTDQGAIAWRQR